MQIFSSLHLLSSYWRSHFGMCFSYAFSKGMCLHHSHHIPCWKKNFKNSTMVQLKKIKNGKWRRRSTNLLMSYWGKVYRVSYKNNSIVLKKDQYAQELHNQNTQKQAENKSRMINFSIKMKLIFCLLATIGWATSSPLNPTDPHSHVISYRSASTRWKSLYPINCTHAWQFVKTKGLLQTRHCGGRSKNQNWVWEKTK